MELEDDAVVREIPRSPCLAPRNRPNAKGENRSAQAIKNRLPRIRIQIRARVHPLVHVNKAREPITPPRQDAKLLIELKKALLQNRLRSRRQPQPANQQIDNHRDLPIHIIITKLERIEPPPPRRQDNQGPPKRTKQGEQAVRLTLHTLAKPHPPTTLHKTHHQPIQRIRLPTANTPHIQQIPSEDARVHLDWITRDVGSQNHRAFTLRWQRERRHQTLRPSFPVLRDVLLKMPGDLVRAKTEHGAGCGCSKQRLPSVVRTALRIGKSIL